MMRSLEERRASIARVGPCNTGYEHRRLNLEDPESGPIRGPAVDRPEYVVLEQIDHGTLMAGDGSTTKAELIDPNRRTCKRAQGARCSCSPKYLAEVFDRRSGKRIYQTFPTLAADKAWRSDAMRDIRQGVRRGPTGITLHQAAQDWLAGARDGSVRNRSGDVYKPSVVRSYEASLTRHVLPALGGHRLEAIDRLMLHPYVDTLVAEGLDPSTIRNTLMPLRVIYRRAVSRGVLAINPVEGVELPAVRGRRERIASPDEADTLVAALPAHDRPIWATAIYSGLRAGELQALAWDCVDLATGIIRVERAWDPKSKVYVSPKSRAGRRKVPVLGVLRDILLDLRMAGPSDGLVFPGSAREHLALSSVQQRAQRCWLAAGLDPITLHECRHTFASLLIAAGVNAKALSVYMGHASISTTFDRYGHLMPGGEDEAAALADAYLERANARVRLAVLDGDCDR
jgi:integrase